jgi:DNA-binding MarR family transcriptional regulator
MESDAVRDAISSFSRVNTVLEPLRIQIWETYGVTVTQLRLMYLIHERGEPSLRDLAQVLRITGPTLSGIVDRLIDRKVVDRRHDDVDRRIVRVSLTAEGESLLRILEYAGRSVLGEAFEAIGTAATLRLAADLASFADALNTVIAHREPVPPARGPTPKAAVQS